MAAVSESPSVLLKNMQGSRFPIAVAHGEGLAHFEGAAQYQAMVLSGGVAMRFVDGYGAPTERYPANPNGSPGGITGITSMDGRALIMMPHPERVFRTVQNSWHPSQWGEDAPAMRMFRNARRLARLGVSYPLYKIELYVPESHLAAVKTAMFEAGAGRIGNYDFVPGKPEVRAIRPLDGSSPFFGNHGQIETVIEHKLEMVCEEQCLEAVIAALKRAHPYEEVAYTVIRTET